MEWDGNGPREILRSLIGAALRFSSLRMTEEDGISRGALVHAFWYVALGYDNRGRWPKCLTALSEGAMPEAGPVSVDVCCE